MNSQFQCDYCNHALRTINSWKKHMEGEIRQKIKNLTCKNCNYKAKSKTDLIRHMKRRVCRDGIIPRDQCEYCGKLFVDSASLSYHVDKEVCLPKDEIHKWVIKFLHRQDEEPLFDTNEEVKSFDRSNDLERFYISSDEGSLTDDKICDWFDDI